MRRVRLSMAMGVTLVTLVALAGCSSGDSDDTSAGLTGEPVRIGVMAPIAGATLAFPDIPKIAKAAEHGINSRGGVKGRPIQIVVCDDKDEAGTAAQCANKLVNEDKVLFVTGTIGRQQATLLSALEAAKIPLFCNTPVVTQELTSQWSFPCGSARVAFSNVALVLDPAADRIGMAGFSTSAVTGDYIRAGLHALGRTTQVDNVLTDTTTTDWVPVATQLKANGDKAVVTALQESAAIQLMQAMKQVGLNIPVVSTTGTLGQQFLDQVQSNGLKATLLATYQLDGSKSARRQQMIDDAAKYASDIDDTISESTIATWLGPNLFAEAVNNGTITDISSAGIVKWLNSGPIDTGMSAPLDFTKPGPSPKEPRAVNVYALPCPVVDGELSATTDTFESALAGPAPKR
ncbi:ABC transporter substrate-binding protein [Amycolatopsis thermophila]|uniref:ABC-type branched-subunit amino acid transport system substrate-binding protein n=1 Tax=Amycolatopsis thermophila TaxID=206084 RepID=A0ABU0F6E7_9PSEU|nr:ABC transporter substrate-binding protein [Amycolatopsis thermophila]MDQ0382686.1 ABC-type branched-subunit amino acid transport system substrate-binding protein [Amycolatopsis thermophila]